ncbi:hypothetical protein [Limosilactobacillus sp.]|jgi:hypothetical protein|uniref:hypothetical protein n=1 Tax=Limosilactobacillus sp. TaxID=2773925 RepID=UPI0025BB12EB|nr:hypothetical protein [Limosilactobacillus sp.]MCH3922351.1 hypothetical protein [Limosilactobacillus sp.]MCH3929123.1 hypothetical protein [Limosilactobacillus sp.]
MKIEMTPREFAEYQEYRNRHRTRRDPRWIQLQHEISAYCHGHETMRRSFSTQQNFIYGAIRFVTGINQIDQLSGSQVDLARLIFHELAEKRFDYSQEGN